MHNDGAYRESVLKKSIILTKVKCGKVADNLINRDFSATIAPFQKWTTDVSQFNFSWGKCYLSPIFGYEYK